MHYEHDPSNIIGNDTQPQETDAVIFSLIWKKGYFSFVPHIRNSIVTIVVSRSCCTTNLKRRKEGRGKGGKGGRRKEGKRVGGKEGRRKEGRGEEGKRERGKEGKKERRKEGKKERRKEGNLAISLRVFVFIAVAVAVVILREVDGGD